MSIKNPPCRLKIGKGSDFLSNSFPAGVPLHILPEESSAILRLPGNLPCRCGEGIAKPQPSAVRLRLYYTPQWRKRQQKTAPDVFFATSRAVIHSYYLTSSIRPHFLRFWGSLLSHWTHSFLCFYLSAYFPFLQAAILAKNVRHFSCKWENPQQSRRFLLTRRGSCAILKLLGRFESCPFDMPVNKRRHRP